MGIIKSNVKVFLDAKRRGVDFSNAATLGRMRWYVTETGDKYADRFFKEVLGTKNLTVIDNSTYQGAGVVHDLNKDIPETLEEKFDVVIDSGTLEHVFNFPTAIKNCMRMVKIGGTIFISTPANNYCGHVFYQFSPELFFRIFSEENGFEVTKMYVLKHPYPGAELSKNQKLYEVRDPKILGQRVGLVSSSLVLLMIEVRRVSKKTIFAEYPQQSDYVTLWNKTENKQKKDKKELIKNIINKLPRQIKNFIWGNLQLRNYSFSNRKFFKRWKDS